jgi:prepilin-type N-terminal cleavage/methylation domain-containing protein
MIKNSKGLTLIELLTCISIISIIILGIYGILGNVLNTWQYGSEKIDAQQNARIVLQMIEKDIKRAEPNQYNGGNDSVLIEASHGKGVALNLKIIDNGQLKEIRYFKEGKIIFRRVDGTSNQLAYDINDLEFNYYRDPTTEEQNRSLVTIAVKVEYREKSYSLSSNVYIRSSDYSGGN